MPFNRHFYSKWYAAKSRCENKTSDRYNSYGARGIKILWPDLKAFHKDMHKSYLAHVKKHGKRQTTLDRKDTNGNYCKENCKWSTWNEQMSNLQKSHIIEFDGKRLTMRQWAREVKLPYKALEHRIYRGWPIEKALTMPLIPVKERGLNFRRLARL